MGYVVKKPIVAIIYDGGVCAVALTCGQSLLRPANVIISDVITSVKLRPIFTGNVNMLFGAKHAN